MSTFWKTVSFVAQIRALVILLCVTGISPVIGADSTSAKEYQVKAAFLYNFTKFVEWPPKRFPASDSPIVIGVLGKNPFGTELENAIKDRKVNGRSFAFKTIVAPEEAKAVHLLFIPASEDHRVREILKQLEEANVLTVGESAAFANAGGMINFLVEGDKARFEINIDAAEQAGLNISAQLQKLAKVVRRKS
jgi:hypothetical protein